METQYTHWNGEVRTWNPDTCQMFFLLIDGQVTWPTGEYFPYSATCYSSSAEETKQIFERFKGQYPGGNWSEHNPRIVKAPCAFDASHTHVVVEYLN